MPHAVKAIDWNALIGQEVRLYRNLNNHRMSLQQYIPGKGWRLAGHSFNCVMQNIHFEVKPAARERIVRTGHKEVCAFAVGTLVSQFPTAEEVNTISMPLSYDPFFSAAFFHKETRQALAPQCDRLIVLENQVFLSQDALIAPVAALPCPQLSLFA